MSAHIDGRWGMTRFIRAIGSGIEHIAITAGPVRHTLEQSNA